MHSASVSLCFIHVETEKEGDMRIPLLQTNTYSRYSHLSLLWISTEQLKSVKKILLWADGLTYWFQISISFSHFKARGNLVGKLF